MHVNTVTISLSRTSPSRDPHMTFAPVASAAALNRTEMDRLMEMDVLNSGQESYDKYGPMLPETKAVLDDFYRPFVTKFADLLHDQRFLWRDVTH